MRTLMRLLVALTLAGLLVACGGGGEVATSDTATSEPPATEAAPEVVATTEAAVVVPSETAIAIPSEAADALDAIDPDECLAAAEAFAGAVSAVPTALSGGAELNQLQEQVETLRALVNS